MSNPIYNLAFDFGASSGLMILSKTEDGKITLEELHRFTNDPVRIGKVFYFHLIVIKRMSRHIKTYHLFFIFRLFVV